ncbi:hypothetical protein [Edaphobacter modestus]|uniref:Uncharacterized protein n=1 Tax=Edaphobacter modestus TaxID=388466 RepID=A0A4Q7Z176_9BACT|nr:hypothetical protein [Edaphobacter modestus]RZU43381.1 hypothetical protein BDD14_5040 [Edaphobacter modestus]
MKSLRTTNVLLAAIAVLLLALVLRPLRAPDPVYAQSPDTDFFFEPGVFLVRGPDDSRQAYAKVVVDLRNGRVWGFPTLTPLPYPSDPVYNKPQTSHPFELGRFAIEDTKKFIPDAVTP